MERETESGTGPGPKSGSGHGAGFENEFGGRIQSETGLTLTSIDAKNEEIHTMSILAVQRALTGQPNHPQEKIQAADGKLPYTCTRFPRNRPSGIMSEFEPEASSRTSSPTKQSSCVIKTNSNIQFRSSRGRNYLVRYLRPCDFESRRAPHLSAARETLIYAAPAPPAF
ncbi:hypothetical protein EVAR_81760_1 [Eumeta japonica]|uniref:Uncharacterized protein n=1 Tax=Eumeta variegata TaxID=151549 RepID=A0A4C1UHI5_EUMVA|nr:hypothetical protein EVAR_81760_1 [Eumeta japonica]